MQSRLFAPGCLLMAEVVSVYRDRAILAFGGGVRLEVALRAPLREGERVRVRVEPRSPGRGLVLRLVTGEERLDRLL